MSRPRPIPIALALALLTGPSWLHAGIPGYAELVGAAQAADPETAILSLSVQKASLALREAELGAAGPGLVLSSGSGGLLLAPDGPALSLSPSVEYGLPGGQSLKIELPLSFGEDQVLAYPLLDLSLPLIRKGDPARVAIASARADLEAATRALGRRRREVERLVAAALLEQSRVEYSLLGAQREVAIARQAVQKAVTLDGAAKGGSTLLTLERELRVKERKERDTRASLSRSTLGLARLCNLDVEADGAFLSPIRVEGVAVADLDRSLPSLQDLATVDLARSELRLALVAAEEGTKARGLSLGLSAGWSSLSPTGTTVLPGFRTGLSYAGRDFDLGLSLGYQGLDGNGAGSGPLLLFQAAWKPQGGKKAELELEGLSLAVARAEARLASTIQEGRKSLIDLAARREDLRASALDSAEDLAFAAEELSIYGSWREKGAVTDSEYEEVLAFEREARARAQSAGLEALVWSLDADLLGTTGKGS